MKGERTYKSKKAILVTSDKLRYLDKFLSLKFDTISYTAYCIDDTKLLPESFDELLQYENPTFKRITGLRIKSFSEKQKAELEVHLGGVGFNSSGDLTNFSFSYQDANWGFEIEKELVERLREFYPWYWWLRLIPFFAALPLSIFGLILILLIIIGGIAFFQKLFGVYTPPSNINEPSDPVNTAVTMFIATALFLVGLAVDGLISYRFPGVFFCLGRQNEEYDKRKRKFNTIFGTFVGGITLAVLANIISNWII